MGDLGGFASNSALVDACSAIRLDHDKLWPVLAEYNVEIPRYRSSEASDAGLDEDMGRRLRQLSDDFVEHGRVALHHEAWNAFVARPGRVGHNDPVVVPRHLIRKRNGIIVCSGNADDLRSKA